MNRYIVALLLVISSSACDAFNTVTEGLQQSQGVAAEMEKLTGSKPFVGFKWNNGSLTSVTINSTDILKDKSLTELAEIARASVKKQFKQEPNQITLGFTVSP